MRREPASATASWLPIAVTAAAILVSPAAAALEMPPVLSDGVVFQRGKPIRLWGMAKPGERVTVSWGRLNGAAGADAGGRWRVDLPAAQQVSGDTIEVSGSAGAKLQIRNALLGQVWLCGGQSNMAMQLMRTDEARTAGENLPAPARLRLFRAPTPDIRRANEGVWVDDSAAAASRFSAVCYLTGRMLATQARDTVALIDTSVGATGIEAWVPDSGQAGVVSGQGRRGGGVHSMTGPGTAFNAVVKPLTPFNARGLLWYQGEGDARNPGRYAEAFTTTMSHWRKAFEQPDLPIVYMQLPTFPDSPQGRGWDEVRRQQARAERMLPGLMMAPSDGIVASEIHPTNKAEVARRLFQRASAAKP